MRIECETCGERHESTATFACRVCGGRLAVTYDGDLDRPTIAAGTTLFEKYGARLPSAGTVAGVEGGTPLLRADRLATALDVDATVYVKDERRNPTNSFKDRALAPALSLAVEAGEEAVVTASSGNAAAACAHYAARAGVECYLLVETETPPGKLVEPRSYGARVVRVDGLFEGGEVELASLLRTLADRLDAYLTFAYKPFNPVLLEGVKTISYEVAEQLDWTAPDIVVTATGGGDNLAAQYTGYEELRDAGLVESTPRMVAAQAAGAAPVADAVARGLDHPLDIESPDTVASGIGAPFAGDHAMEAICRSGGTAIGVTDDALLTGESLLSRTTAVWPEPSSAVVVPALTELAERGALEPDSVVVLTITGSGHKHPEPFEPTLPLVPRASKDPDDVAAAFEE